MTHKDTQDNLKGQNQMGFLIAIVLGILLFGLLGPLGIILYLGLGVIALFCRMVG